MLEYHENRVKAILHQIKCEQARHKDTLGSLYSELREKIKSAEKFRLTNAVPPCYNDGADAA